MDFNPPSGGLGGWIYRGGLGGWIYREEPVGWIIVSYRFPADHTPPSSQFPEF